MWYNQFNHVLLSMLSPHSTKLLVLHVYFLPQYLNAMPRVPPQKVEAITVCYWRQTAEQSRVKHDAPAFIADVGSHHVYGMPAIEYPDLCKVQPHPPPPAHASVTLLTYTHPFPTAVLQVALFEATFHLAAVLSD